MFSRARSFGFGLSANGAVQEEADPDGVELGKRVEVGLGARNDDRVIVTDGVEEGQRLGRRPKDRT